MALQMPLEEGSRLTRLRALLTRLTRGGALLTRGRARAPELAMVDAPSAEASHHHNLCPHMYLCISRHRHHQLPGAVQAAPKQRHVSEEAKVEAGRPV